MLNDRDEKYEGHDEGEYHFSDEHASSYDTEPEAAKQAPLKTAVDFHENVLAKLKENRRIIIGAVVFLVLIFIVYRFLQPSNSVATSEFAQANAMQAASATKLAQQQVAPPVAPPQQAAVQQPPPIAPTPIPQQIQQPVVAPPVPMPEQQAAIPMPTPATGPTSAYAQPLPAQAPSAVSIPAKSPMERLAVLEDQNAKIMNAMQADFAPKITGNAAESAAVQAKMQELNNRVANIEANLNRLTQLLQAVHRPPASYVGAPPLSPPPRMMAATVPVMAPESRSVYTVQAIIPGRAWLKSESGDTVTVAEGDVIKAYGRVVKIDPYDGVVSIDTGNKVVTLSYGSSGD